MTKKNKPTHPWRISGLILGIIGLPLLFLTPDMGILFSITAVVFSVIQKNYEPTGMATAGLVIGIIGIIGIILYHANATQRRICIPCQICSYMLSDSRYRFSDHPVCSSIPVSQYRHNGNHFDYGIIIHYSDTNYWSYWTFYWNINTQHPL